MDYSSDGDDIDILDLNFDSEDGKTEKDRNESYLKKSSVQTLEVFPYQVQHLKELLNILTENYGALSSASFGTGKTVMSLAVAIILKMGIIVIAPKSVLPGWDRQAKKYGVSIYASLTYNSLGGTETHGLNHDLLLREKDEFFPTDKIEKFAQQGLLIVFDECHYLKNENTRLKAAHALTKEGVRLARQGYNVRSLALSATPADKKENITSLFKILGIILSDKLYTYNRSNKTYVPQGLQEAINMCERYDRDTTFHITLRPINKTTCKTICHELYTRILKEHITSSMPEPPLETKKDIKNLFVIMEKEDVERLKKGALMFSSATSYQPETNEIDYKGINWGQVTQSRKEIDSAKVNATVRITKETLIKYPMSKVILYFTYKRDMKRAKELLYQYNPQILNGEVVKDSDRTKIIDLFNEDSDRCRVLISNPKVGGVGIELDDKIGNRPRFEYILPNYNFIDQFQATGRIHRKDTKSKATIRFIYSRDFPWETGVLNSMVEKSRVARDMMRNNQKDIIFPGELDEIIEKTQKELEGEDDE
jgi:hypothetical protein